MEPQRRENFDSSNDGAFCYTSGVKWKEKEKEQEEGKNLTSSEKFQGNRGKRTTATKVEENQKEDKEGSI